MKKLYKVDCEIKSSSDCYPRFSTEYVEAESKCDAEEKALKSVWRCESAHAREVTEDEFCGR